MSYEGYEQYLCAKGHLRVFDCWDGCMVCDTKDIPEKKCSCGEPFVFHHSVDETNGIIEDDSSTQGYPFEVDVPAVTHTCSCGNVHIIEEVRYKIPTKRHEDNCIACLEPQFCDCKCETCEESRRKWVHDYEYRKYLDDFLDPRD